MRGGFASFVCVSKCVKDFAINNTKQIAHVDGHLFLNKLSMDKFVFLLFIGS